MGREAGSSLFLKRNIYIAYRVGKRNSRVGGHGSGIEVVASHSPKGKSAVELKLNVAVPRWTLQPSTCAWLLSYDPASCRRLDR